jgi:hypothetical protein
MRRKTAENDGEEDRDWGRPFSVFSGDLFGNIENGCQDRTAGFAFPPESVHSWLAHNYTIIPRKMRLQPTRNKNR